MRILPSTRSWFRERRNLPGYSLIDFLHGYFYARWPYLYISVAVGEHRFTRIIKPIYERISALTKNGDTSANSMVTNHSQKTSARRFADTYHGKVVPLDEAQKLVSIKQDVSLKHLEHVIPYNEARDIVLKNPDHIAVLQCPCRTSRKNPCTPLDVCLIVGEPFAGFILEHHPGKARKITSDQAVDILREEDKRGHVHHAFFKDAMLGRFYAICNCCKCCCGAMQAHRNGTPMLASSGYVAKVDQSRCVACGTCAKYCQFDAVLFIDGKKMIDSQKCLGCGICVSKCTQNALSLEEVPDRGLPLRMDELIEREKKLAEIN
jgi:Pyruvate/2-oxoacid:ferredoxin oxidoreductase delta subunit